MYLFPLHVTRILLLFISVTYHTDILVIYSSYLFNTCTHTRAHTTVVPKTRIVFSVFLSLVPIKRGVM